MTVLTASAGTVTDSHFKITATEPGMQSTTAVMGGTTFLTSSDLVGYPGSLETPVGTISGGVRNATGSLNPGIGFAKDGGIVNWLVAGPNEGTVTISFVNDESYFGLLWGSIDPPNAIAFYNGSSLIASYTGEEIVADNIGSKPYPEPASFIDFQSVTAASAFNKVVLSSGSPNFFEQVNYATLVAAAPSIKGLEPSSLDAGSAAFTLTVNGSNFLSGDTVEWNGVPLPTTFVSASKLTAKVSAAEVAAAGSAAVTVVDSAAPSQTGKPALFPIYRTSIVIKSQTIKAEPGEYSIALTLQNSGFNAATDISLTGGGDVGGFDRASDRYRVDRTSRYQDHDPEFPIDRWRSWS
jgi:hypothetical protein